MGGVPDDGVHRTSSLMRVAYIPPPLMHYCHCKHGCILFVNVQHRHFFINNQIVGCLGL